jgi:hypothetical protein
MEVLEAPVVAALDPRGLFFCRAGKFQTCGSHLRDANVLNRSVAGSMRRNSNCRQDGCTDRDSLWRKQECGSKEPRDCCRAMERHAPNMDTAGRVLFQLLVAVDKSHQAIAQLVDF